MQIQEKGKYEVDMMVAISSGASHEIIQSVRSRFESAIRPVPELAGEYPSRLQVGKLQRKDIAEK